jgi:serine/threonine protein kinase
MNNDTSVFGVPPEKLDRLILFGLEPPAAQQDATPTASVDMLLEKVGSWIQGYRLIDLLGEGGMGMVYLAEQTVPMRRRVALKVIKPGMDSKRVIARFEAERQALALLDHPNIAHVYDAGTTDSGRPYFVMEHVKGLPITSYCDRHKLTIDERLGLFQRVCHGVQHAHQKGIIHRDLKPSNILVSTEGDEAIPKIIDFGVAKAITQPLTERTLFTEDGHLLGTPEYMSPEQADMANEDIDTRSDIYSLGVLLYVLLTGILPYDSQTFREGGIEHIRKTIRETDPKTPSTRLAKLGEEAKKLAASRRTEVATLTRRLHKELEWIPLKATRKERSERYRSASELADDIENYLKGEPLIAGAPSTVYRLRKFVGRNRAWVVGLAAVLAVLAVGIVISILFAIKADRARAEAQAVAGFLAQDVFGSVRKVRGREATVADILGPASASLEGRFRDQPLVEEEIRWHVGWVYFRLGDHRAAIPHFERVYQLRRGRLGERQGPVVVARNWLALTYKNTGQYDEAERLFDELIAARQRGNPENVGLLPWYKCNLATVYVCQGRYKEAEALLVETLASQTAWWKGTRPEGKPYLDKLAEIYLYQGRYKLAEQLFQQTVEAQGHDGTSDPEAAVRSIDGLGRLYTILGRYPEAEKQFLRGIDAGQRWLPGKDYPDTLRNVNDLAVLRTRQKNYEDAERLFHEVLEARALKLGEDHPDTLESKNDLAVLYREQARYEDAEPLLLDAFHGREAKLGPQHPDTIESLKQLVTLYESWPKPDEADKWRAKLPRKEDPRE